MATSLRADDWGDTSETAATVSSRRVFNHLSKVYRVVMPWATTWRFAGRLEHQGVVWRIFAST